MAEIHGSSDTGFEVLADLLSGSIDQGTDVGASISVTIEGETVVDIWGGQLDRSGTTPWQRDTITNVWSTTKTMMSLVALMLVERGQLDVYAPVATYWPEFAANGKEAIEVRHLLSHTSGVSGWEQPIAVEDLYDGPAAAARLATQSPWWEPGTASGYHALNQGHLIGELVRRTTGRTIGTFFAEEVAGPLGADFHIGLDDIHFDRVAPVIPELDPTDTTAVSMDSPAFKTYMGPRVDPLVALTPEWRRAEIAAANGHGNARSVARIQAIVANGGTLDGKTFLSPETIDVIFDEQSFGDDLVLGLPQRFGVGYGLADSTIRPHIPEGRICFWGGWGGSSIVVDTERRMTVAYMMNLMLTEETATPRSHALVQATYAALGVSTG